MMATKSGNLKGVEVHDYNRLLNDYKVKAFFTKVGVFARVSSLKNNASDADAYWLPVNNDFSRCSGDPEKIRQFLSHCFPDVKKGISGRYESVSYRLAARGGTKAQIPFQAGLALGSVVNTKTIEQLNSFAKASAESGQIERRINACEKRIEALESKIQSKKMSDEQIILELGSAESRKNNSRAENIAKLAELEGLGAEVIEYKKYYRSLVKRWKAEIEQLVKLIEKMTGQGVVGPEEGAADQDQVNNDIPVSFYSSIQSPLIVTKENMETLDIGFKSGEYHSQYINTKEESAVINDKVKKISGSASVGVSGGIGLYAGGVEGELEGAIASRVGEIQKNGLAKGVYIISSLITTEYIQTLTKLVFDRDRLRSTLMAMKAANDDKICILTQAILGGSYTALATVADEEKMEQRLRKRALEGGIGGKIEAGTAKPVGTLNIKADANLSASIRGGVQSEMDKLASIVTSIIDIEIIAQGAVPNFSVKEKIQEVVRFSDVSLAGNSLKTKEGSSTQKDEASSSEKQLRRLEDMEEVQALQLSKARGYATQIFSQKVHSIESIQDGYENYIAQLQTGKNCGIPIGFNYIEFTRKDLEAKYTELAGKAIDYPVVPEVVPDVKTKICKRKLSL